MPNTFKGVLTVLRDAFKLLVKNDPLRMGGATAFFTMFALPPIIIILVQVFGLFISPQTIKHQLFTNMSGIFGREAMRQIVSIIRAFRGMANNTFANIIGFVFLLFVATTLFKVIKGCINQIWAVDLPTGETAIKTVQSRLAAFLIILIAGVLLVLGIFIETIQALIGQYIIRFFPSISGFLNQSIGFLLSTFIVSVWFFIIFRYLPNERPKWKVAFVGALFTSFLFSLGKIVLHLLLNYNNVTTIYGVSAAIVLLLLFIFYSAMILYYGAAFTKVWSVYKKQPIELVEAV